MFRSLLMAGWILVLVTSTRAAERPNFVLIMADDLAVHDLGCYGQKLIRTPQIDRLASEGTRFTQVYAGASVCAPSRSVLMTGLHTGHTRVRGNHSRTGGIIGETGEQGRVPLRDEDLTIAEVLKQSGYATGIAGKWGLGEPGSTGIPNRQGFDNWLGYLNQDKAANYFPDALWKNQEQLKLPGNADGKQQQYSHDLFTEFALNFIQQHKSDPFFLYVAYTIPHVDHQVPDLGPYAAQTWPGKAREYAAMITRMDADVGRIATLVDKLGLADNTLILFCSDNGGPAPFQDVFQSNGQLRGHKGQLYEGGLRIPTLARWPGHIPSGRVSSTPWYLADIFPTLVELSGSPIPAKLDGVSVLPTLQGKELPISDRFLYWEQTSNKFQQAVRWKTWKAIRTGLRGPVELYDLAQDPTESKNIAKSQPQVVLAVEDFLKSARTDSAEWPISDSAD